MKCHSPDLLCAISLPGALLDSAVVDGPRAPRHCISNRLRGHSLAPHNRPLAAAAIACDSCFGSSRWLACPSRKP